MFHKKPKKVYLYRADDDQGGVQNWPLTASYREAVDNNIGLSKETRIIYEAEVEWKKV